MPRESVNWAGPIRRAKSVRFAQASHSASFSSGARSAPAPERAARAALSYEHGQLSTANSRIASDLFDFLEE